MTAPRNRVCHLTTAHRWYDERVFQKESKSLARAGYDVVLVVPRDEAGTVDRVRVVPLRSASSKLKRLAWWDWLALWRAWWANAQLYHLHDPELIPAGLLLKLCGKKVIYDVHEDYRQTVLSAKWLPAPLRGIVSLLWDAFERLSSRLFDGIIVVDSQIRRNFPPQKTEMITNVPPLGFLSNGERKKTDDVFRLVYTGVGSERRGILKLVAALDHLGREDVELHLFGHVATPDLESRLEAHPRVVCHGRVPWEQLRTAMAAADAGTLLFQPTPAHLKFTGEGNTKLFEFMALGLPVIHSDFPELSKLMRSIGAGIAVDPTDPRAIAEAIQRLRTDADLYRRLSENGTRAVRERYHWEHEEKKLLDVYRRLLDGRRGGTK